MVKRALFMFCVAATCVAVDRAAADERRIILFRTAAPLDEESAEWVVPIHGWVFDPEERSLLRGATLRLLRRALDDDENREPPAIFKSRARPFLVDNLEDQRVTIRIGQTSTVMKPTDGGGHFSGEIRVPAGEAAKLAQQGKLLLVATDPAARPTAALGEALLVPPRGLSVISDVDDTVRVSNVLDRRKLIDSTFYRVFEAAPGMADLYRRWAGQGAAFHWLSASPWQLYPALLQFQADEKFPPAVMHLNRFRVKDSSFWSLMTGPLRSKPPMIDAILGQFPGRRFILVGDSGQKDPEIYGAIFRGHPGRIAAIYIRNVTGEKPDGERFAKVFDGVPPERWRVFDDPAALPDLPAVDAGK
jgi:phosphatidate phosphatase APP1